MTFAAALPAWTGADGLPLSFRHFVHGMAHIGRSHLRDELARAQATRNAGLKLEDFQAYQRDTLRVTEVPHDG